MILPLACAAAQSADPSSAPAPAITPALLTSSSAAIASPAAGELSISEVLDAVDRAAVETTVVSARFVSTRTDALTEESERRTGDLVVSGQGVNRRAAILVRDFIDGTGRLERENRHFVYGEGWLTEYVPGEQRATSRQLALPGEDYDPLRAGEGPIPLPVGQRRADLERGFSCELATWPADIARGSDAAVVVARLTPRDGTSAARELASVLLAWDRLTWQPVAVWAQSTDGSTTLVQLRDVALNGAVDESFTALLSAPILQGGEWSVDRRPLERSGEAPTSPAPSQKEPD